MFDERPGSRSRKVVFLVWHLFFAAVIVWVIPRILLSASLPSLTPTHRAIVVAFAGAYAISLLGRWFLMRVYRFRGTVATVAATASSLAAVYLGVLLLEPEYSRALVL